MTMRDSCGVLDTDLFGKTRQPFMLDLFPIPGAELYYDDHFLSPEEATQLFNTLLGKCAWERRTASFGHAVPRDEAYYGDPETHYTYSRREYNPLPWIPELVSLKTRVEEATPATAYANFSLPRTGYNAVLCNPYVAPSLDRGCSKRNDEHWVCAPSILFRNIYRLIQSVLPQPDLLLLPSSTRSRRFFRRADH
jgi:hypothetical protein